MNIIFAKHDGCERDFVFEVPNGMHPVKNDILWVDTSKGETVAIATSGVITGFDDEELDSKFGAYFPLKKVKTYANNGLKIYIENDTYKKISNYCHREQRDIHEPQCLPF